MNTARIYLLIAILMLCATGGMAGGAMLLRVSTHPLATDDMWSTFVIFDLPYFLLALAGLLSYPRAWLLISLVIVSALVGFMITAACYQHMELGLFVLDAKAAGRHGMACGPPMSVFVLPVAYLMSLVAMVAGLGTFSDWLVRKVSYAPRAQ
jgi:hypothetical protein